MLRYDHIFPPVKCDGTKGTTARAAGTRIRVFTDSHVINANERF